MDCMVHSRDSGSGWSLEILRIARLILEAAEEKGHHHFTADGIEQSSQSIYPIYNNDYEKMGRLDMLRNLRNYRDNNNSIIKASTGGMLDFGPDAPVQTEYDFLETDYR